MTEPHFQDVPAGALLIEQIRNVGKRLTHLSNGRTIQGGVSYSRARILAYLMKEGSKRATDLAQLLRQAPRTITEAIDGLERDGLVTRDADPADRRVKRITVTELGQKAAYQASVHAIAFGNEIGATLGEPDLAQLQVLLGRIEQYLDAVEGPVREEG